MRKIITTPGYTRGLGPSLAKLLRQDYVYFTMSKTSDLSDVGLPRVTENLDLTLNLQE